MKLLKIYKNILTEDLGYSHVSDATTDSYVMGENELRFNNGQFNKSGPNTIYLDGNPIVDFGVGEIGTITVADQVIPNAIYLKGGFNASEQKKGYGSLGLGFIFQKLIKIDNIVLQCYEKVCPFWVKMGAVELTSKEIAKGVNLKTMVITRANFNTKRG